MSRRPIPGNRYFECEECGTTWFTPTRDCKSPSMEHCPSEDCEFSPACVPCRYDEVDHKVDVNGNLVDVSELPIIYVTACPHTVSLLPVAEGLMVVSKDSPFVEYGTLMKLNANGTASLINEPPVVSVDFNPLTDADKSQRKLGMSVTVKPRYTIRDSIMDRNAGNFPEHMNSSDGWLAYAESVFAQWCDVGIGVVTKTTSNSIQSLIVADTSLIEFSEKHSELIGSPSFWFKVLEVKADLDWSAFGKELLTKTALAIDELSKVFEQYHKRKPTIKVKTNSNSIQIDLN